MSIHFSSDSSVGFILLNVVIPFLVVSALAFFYARKYVNILKERTGKSFGEIIKDLKRYNENQRLDGKQLTELDEEELAKNVSQRMEGKGETLEQALKNEGAGEYAENKTVLELTRIAAESMAAERRWKKEKHPFKYVSFIIFLAIFIYISLNFFRFK